MSKPVKETASFRIKNGDASGSISFKVEGSTVAALVEAFSWLTPERRLNVLNQLKAKQAKLLSDEASKRAASTPQVPALAGDQPAT